MIILYLYLALRPKGVMLPTFAAYWCSGVCVCVRVCVCAWVGGCVCVCVCVSVLPQLQIQARNIPQTLNYFLSRSLNNHIRYHKSNSRKNQIITIITITSNNVNNENTDYRRLVMMIHGIAVPASEVKALQARQDFTGLALTFTLYLDPPFTLYTPTIKDHIPLFKGTKRVLVRGVLRLSWLEFSASGDCLLYPAPSCGPPKESGL